MPRYWDKVIAKVKRKPLAWRFEGTCIRCTSHASARDGYIRIKRRERGRQVTQLLHRLILQRRLGRHPQVARHTCDHPWCINPDHIVDGTQADNVHDMESRGRANHVIGEANGRSILTKAQVIEIKASNLLQRELASLYGVARQTIGEIKRGVNWKYLTEREG